MATVDPFIPLNNWPSALLRGNSAVVDRFLDRIDATLPPNWLRDREYEQTRPRPVRIHCYRFDRAPDAALRAWLQRVTPTRVRGGAVQVLRQSPTGDAGRIGRIIAEFVDSCVASAAQTTGIHFTHPKFGPRSVVAPDAEMLFTQFADTADGMWPLVGRSEELWDDLLSNCLADQVAIDRRELADWLADSGWDADAVTAIADKFFTDSDRLARRPFTPHDYHRPGSGRFVRGAPTSHFSGHLHTARHYPGAAS